MSNDELLMQRCLSLAEAGIGQTAPNPLVGALLVRDGQIIGEGYHRKYGGPHAEVNAINAVSDPELLKQATLYVNLEPCSHFGKTPPCADLIISKGIPKVVIGMLDPNPMVSGKGVEKLTKAGINTKVGICKELCRYQNRRFITFQEQKRPFIILKWAQTLDGFMDIDRGPGDTSLTRNDHWITNEAMRILVHKWRSVEMSIAIGKQTLLSDDPQLTIRDWHGKQPIRIVMANNIEMKTNFKLFSEPGPILVFHNKQSYVKDNIEYIHLEESSHLNEMLDILYNKGINSILVEGGRKLLDSFINQGLWDEARILTGNKHFFKGLKAPKMLQGTIRAHDRIENDEYIIIENTQL